jgi:hypothetical protein
MLQSNAAGVAQQERRNDKVIFPYKGRLVGCREWHPNTTD